MTNQYFKHTISHSCGHKEERLLKGSKKDRKKISSWLRAHTCLQCQSKSYFDEAKANGYPDLRGTKNQILWAVKLRSHALSEGYATEAEVQKCFEAKYWIEKYNQIKKSA